MFNIETEPKLHVRRNPLLEVGKGPYEYIINVVGGSDASTSVLYMTKEQISHLFVEVSNKRLKKDVTAILEEYVAVVDKIKSSHK